MAAGANRSSISDDGAPTSKRIAAVLGFKPGDLETIELLLQILGWSVVSEVESVLKGGLRPGLIWIAYDLLVAVPALLGLCDVVPPQIVTVFYDTTVGDDFLFDGRFRGHSTSPLHISELEQIVVASS